MVQAAEDGGRGQLTGGGRSSRREPVRACGRLSAQAAMRPAVVVADVLTQDALSVSFAEDQYVIEAISTKRPHQALANRVCQRSSGRRAKASHPEAAEPPPEAHIVDAVAVVQQKAWWRVPDGLDHALRDPRACRMRGDPYVDDPAALGERSSSVDPGHAPST